MNSKVQSLKAFLASAGRVAVVEVAGTKGSTPREKGAFMLVSPTAIFGTIGGGQLEYMAIDKARQMLGKEARIEVDEVCATLDVPLGPEIGQCCGGRVEVLIRLVDAALAGDLVAAAEAEEAHLPYVYIFGGGHVGQALASAIALLPVHGVVIETRAEALEGMPETIETRLTAMPEAMVRNAPAGAAFAILTHDHALDFLIVAEALKRGDTAYVGMIGSKTKKATFRTWFLKSADGSQAEFARLVSPIGGDTVKDKRPQVIAALAAAEIMTALVNHNAALNADHQIPHGKVMAS
ncbi:xanthine dehydrogenase accessory protein XdhC [Mesorhizobium sp. M7A.F.Ca.CA.002.10.1.1]|uniref:xanthine dehydrogenase accessory protein XdhC n=3 Tax=Phyllobacteriaceae TaxID=69277 RepID=UPI0007A94DC4|nr:MULTISPECIES: xanthine dehydrogenase accessory protein XdhC [Mesorhizobium]AMX96303.1 xanthine dehydrogenase accessory protein XdhC [Mesorhizobium ciceri]MDF3206885.1 xanthine dehydrogenase accessory protein XdhC [Mesorhizobium sp. LMG15046]MDF3230451.1 xanthine dehydrogenase accessory protein XdhC [Mesorhizobium sp. DSM 30133]RUU21266.1 xanthine dehydrogenase accessory protein XdhC [Mesorhizobium sp. Primo-B]RUU39923.1 xanthine dehydrogenase accessory protein XdhC [Mesorhizobium sp. Primo-